MDYYVWLAALIRYKQIGDETDVTDRWSAYRSVTLNLCLPVCPSVGPYVLLSFLSSNRHWMSSWLYTRREISELIRQMISQFSEDTYSDVHEMVRKIRLFSSLFLVFHFTRILNIELRLEMARGGSSTKLYTWIAGFVTIYRKTSSATARGRNK